MARLDVVLFLAAAFWLAASEMDGIAADNSGATETPEPGAGDGERQCVPDDYNLQQTQCDSNNQRYFVGVPKAGAQCTGGYVPPPLQGKPCNYTCNPGQHLDVTTQQCMSCPVGTYSLGDGTRWEKFSAKQLPPGFSIKQRNVIEELEKIRKLLDEEQSDIMSSAQELYRMFGQHNRSPRSASERGRRLRRQFGEEEEEDGDSLEKLCAGRGWKAEEGYLVMESSDCSSTIEIEVDLIRDGVVRVQYSLPEDAPYWVLVEVKAFSCAGVAGATHIFRTLNNTRNTFQWQSIPLHEGHNVIAITAISQFQSISSSSVMVSGVEVSGTAYATSCTPCPAGSFADKPSSSRCDKCTGAQYSREGAFVCETCTDVEYPDKDHSTCIAQEPCTDSDYTSMYGMCNSDGLTTLTSEWNTPKLCRTNEPGSAVLPSPQFKVPCPKCNPGMSVQSHHSMGACSFCPVGTVSDGQKACTACGPGFQAVNGYHFHWWEDRTIPEHMPELSCVQEDESSCVGSLKGWRYEKNALALHSSSLPKGGKATIFAYAEEFTGTPAAAGGSGVLGTVQFAYEVTCPPNLCQFSFSDGYQVDGSSRKAVWKWNGEHRTGKEKHEIKVGGFHEFYWTFTVGSLEGWTGKPFKLIRIFSLDINGTAAGGGTHCRDCSGLGMSSKSRGSSSDDDDSIDQNEMWEAPVCVGCPGGQYLDISDDANHKCRACKAGTALSGSRRIGQDSCVPCGQGTTSHAGALSCHSDCTFAGEDNVTYDFSQLSELQTLSSPPHFTTKGTRFKYEYQLSLCGGQLDAYCYSNITKGHKIGPNGPVRTFDQTQTKICRQTMAFLKSSSTMHIYPLNLGYNVLGVAQFEPKPMSSTSNSLAVRTFNASLLSAALSAKLEEPLISLFFHSEQGESHCTNGHMSVVNLMCDPKKKGTGELTMATSEECPEGTCDGCTYSFIWRTELACPVCTKADYKERTLACGKNQTRLTEYDWIDKENRCARGVSLPASKRQPCKFTELAVSDFVKKYLPILLAIPGVALVVLLALVFVICKNRRLKYQYQKLVQTSSAAAELPAPPTCIDDEDEEEDEVMFSRGQSQTNKLVRKLQGFTKSAARKLQNGDDGDGMMMMMDNVPLTESSLM